MPKLVRYDEKHVEDPILSPEKYFGKVTSIRTD